MLRAKDYAATVPRLDCRIARAFPIDQKALSVADRHFCRQTKSTAANLAVIAVRRLASSTAA
jgi:hypothetical protein